MASTAAGSHAEAAQLRAQNAELQAQLAQMRDTAPAGVPEQGSRPSNDESQLAGERAVSLQNARTSQADR